MDKTQLIKQEIERLKNHTLNVQKSTDGLITSVGRGRVEAFNDILKFIDSLQDEPVSENLEKVQLIKKEVERRIEMYKELKPAGDQFYLGQISATKGILKFIDSLQDEPVNEDLEEELRKILDKHYYFSDEDDELRSIPELAKYIAHHFAEWQREKDIKLEKIDDLEKFAQKWAYSNYHKELDEVNCDCLYSGVIKGAEWQKQQIEKQNEDAIKYVKEHHSSSEVSDFQNAMNIAVAKAYNAGRNDVLKEFKENTITCNVDWYDGFLLDYTQEQQDDILLKLGVDVGDKVDVIIIKKEDDDV